MRQRLSSPTTPFAKFVAPVVWPVISVSAVIWIGLHGPGEVMPLFLFFGTVSIVVVCCHGLRLKKVYIDRVFLYVSNYRTEIRIPLSQISDVTDNFLINSRPITIYLRSSTVFGTKITFVPDSWYGGLGSHPIVDHLTALAKSNRAPSQ